MLPSPIPHPLDYCPWDVPGWIHEALDWVVGVEWPDGNERAVWNLADQWYGIADVLARPRTDAAAAAGEVRSGYGGVGLVAEAFEAAWHKVAEGPDAPLPVLLAVTGELGKLVDSCGCDIEGAKLEAWIELGILVIELLSLAVAAVLTAGAASPAAGAAIAASRLAVQQIFKRLVAQLARKALKDGLKEAGERAAKDVVKSGVTGFARRAAVGGLVEAGQEAGTSLATQAYQNSTGRRDGLDLTDVGMSALGGFAGGAVAPLAGLGRRADGRLAQVGEHLGREMVGETLAEGAAGLATGQNLSLEDLARAAVSGVSGSATGQADAALHHRLDGKLGGLAFPPVNPALPIPGAADVGGVIPAQRAPEPVEPATVASVGPATSLTGAGAGHPDAAGPGVAAAGESRQLRTEVTTEVDLTSPVEQSSGIAAPSVHAVPEPASDRPNPEVVARPTLSSVAVESPVTGTHLVAADPRLGPVAQVDAGTSSQTVPVQSNTAPTVTSGSPAVAPHPSSPSPLPADRLSAGPVAPAPGPSSPPPVQRVAADPAAGSTVTGPDNRPAPNPRFPLLEALAPAPRRPADGPPPALPGPFDPLPPRKSVPTPEERAARRAADREALDRRRYQGYLQAQRELYEENRRHSRVKELRETAEQHCEAARWLLSRADELRKAGQHSLAEQHVREGRFRDRLHYKALDEAEAVLSGELLPAEVMIEDDADFYRINDDVADLAPGAVETPNRSALTGDGHPPPIDRSRRYGVRGGLRPPLALHQTDLERQMPRNPDGTVVRTADPRDGGWFRLANDGGPLADPTRSINCLDCTLSLYETWVHGRPRVSAPRTFDGYLMGDVRQPVDGEVDGPMRVEEITGGQFQDLCPGPDPTSHTEVRQRVELGYRDLHGQLLAGGHGSYAFLVTSYEGGGSHAWVALNQNGTVLYLDPQQGILWNRPLYTHRGVSNPANVVGVDALVLGPDGRPMPLAGRPPGAFNVLPELRDRPDPPRPADPPLPYDGDEEPPDFNLVHLLGEDTTFHRADDSPAPGSAPTADPDGLRRAHLDAHTERISAGLFVRDAIAAAASLDHVFAAGVTPVELAHHLDASTLRRLAPELDEAAAGDVARLLADPRVQGMLDQTWEAPPRGEPLLAERLVRQLTQHPDLARMMLDTPELTNSLTARPLTLHHLGSHQKAIDVLGDVLGEIAERGAGAAAASPIPPVQPTPLTTEQLAVSYQFVVDRPVVFQPGFDQSRREDLAYRCQYLDELYEAAAAAQGEIDALGRRLLEASNGDGEYRPRPEPKDRMRAEDKVAKYSGDASRLRDLAAGRISYQRLDDLYAALAALPDDPQVTILEFDDRFLEPQDSGYRDVQMMLRTSSGHVAEFRLQLAALDDVATWEHALFEVRRDLGAVAREEGRSLSAKEMAIRNGIIRRQREYFWAALQSALSGGLE
ncbi:toxin glutamine deamidase domain-containing protein [Micromonospora sp. NPDC007271]|uniref:toxin glutamine deamidase domain-containing protein n=1 Tax=Micromonospora sp. NPDC007271 TaxID=3154587 RepID=UPI0033E1BBFE